MSWSRQRRAAYGLAVAFCAAAAVSLPAFYFFYTPATCDDGKQNQGEQGIDCGGPCRKLCPSSFIAPTVSWTGVEQVSPGLYNVAAYVINPNPSAGASHIPYHVILFDAKGSSINDYYDTVSLQPHRNTLAFRPSFSTGARVPTRALFEFVGSPEWQIEGDPLAALQIVDKRYSEDQTGASLAVTLKNASPLPVDRVTVYAILYDADGNRLGFSKTIVDEVPANGTAIAPFTWPTGFEGKVISIEILPVAE